MTCNANSSTIFGLRLGTLMMGLASAFLQIGCGIPEKGNSTISHNSTDPVSISKHADNTDQRTTDGFKCFDPLKGKYFVVTNDYYDASYNLNKPFSSKGLTGNLQKKVHAVLDRLKPFDPALARRLSSSADILFDEAWTKYWYGTDFVTSGESNMLAHPSGCSSVRLAVYQRRLKPASNRHYNIDGDLFDLMDEGNKISLILNLAMQGGYEKAGLHEEPFRIRFFNAMLMSDDLEKMSYGAYRITLLRLKMHYTLEPNTFSIDHEDGSEMGTFQMSPFLDLKGFEFLSPLFGPTMNPPAVPQTEAGSLKGTFPLKYSLRKSVDGDSYGMRSNLTLRMADKDFYFDQSSMLLAAIRFTSVKFQNSLLSDSKPFEFAFPGTGVAAFAGDGSISDLRQVNVEDNLGRFSAPFKAHKVEFLGESKPRSIAMPFMEGSQGVTYTFPKGSPHPVSIPSVWEIYFNRDSDVPHYVEIQPTKGGFYELPRTSLLIRSSRYFYHEGGYISLYADTSRSFWEKNGLENSPLLKDENWYSDSFGNNATPSSSKAITIIAPKELDYNLIKRVTFTLNEYDFFPPVSLYSESKSLSFGPLQNRFRITIPKNVDPEQFVIPIRYDTFYGSHTVKQKLRKLRDNVYTFSPYIGVEKTVTFNLDRSLFTRNNRISFSAFYSEKGSNGSYSVKSNCGFAEGYSTKPQLNQKVACKFLQYGQPGTVSYSVEAHEDITKAFVDDVSGKFTLGENGNLVEVTFDH